MRGVLKPGGTLLVADFRVPRGEAWRLLAAVTGTAAMEHNSPSLKPRVVV